MLGVPTKIVAEDLAKRFMSYYSNPRGTEESRYWFSGDGFLKLFNELCQDMIQQGIADCALLLLDNDGEISIRYLEEKKNLERGLMILSSDTYGGLVERFAGKYGLSEDLTNVLYRIVHNRLRVFKENKASVLAHISSIKKTQQNAQNGAAEI